MGSISFLSINMSKALQWQHFQHKHNNIKEHGNNELD